MLWLMVILLIGGLSFVIFHKPHVKAMGAGWVPPEQRKLEQKPAAPSTQVTAEGSGAVQQGQQAPAQMPDTFDFNDLYGGKKKKPAATDRPNA